MKVLMLDFDGVLNSKSSFEYEYFRRKTLKIQGLEAIRHTLCNVCTSNLRYVLNTYPELKIVVSSSWRQIYSLDKLKLKFKEYNLDASRIIGITPITGIYPRGKEIQMWLDEHPEVKHYVVIDDTDDKILDMHGEERFVKTSWNSGMHFGHVDDLIRKLSNKHIKQLKDLQKSDE